jgi:hypothetical protein
MNRVTGIDREPDSDGNNVIEVTMTDGVTIDAVIDLAAAQTLVEILQKQLVRYAHESVKNLSLPQLEVTDVAIAHRGPEVALMVTTSQMGLLALRLPDELAQKAYREIERVVTYRSGPQSKN